MIARHLLRAGCTRMMAVIVAVALGLWVSPAVAGKVALTDADLDQVSAGAGSTVIESGGNVTNNDDSQFNLSFDVPEAQIGFRALAIQNVVGELQLLVNLNVLSANGNVNSTDQRNFSLQSWGGTLPIPNTGIVATVDGVAAAPCQEAGSCVTGGRGGDAPATASAGAGGAAAASTGGGGGAGAASASVTANAGQGNGAVGAGGGAGAGAAGAAGATGGSSGAASSGSADASGCTGTCAANSGAATSGAAAAGGTGGTGGAGTGGAGGAGGLGTGGAATATSGNGGSGGNGGNAAAAPGGNGGSITAPAGSGGGAALTVSGGASTSPGVVAISPTASASGDLVIRTTTPGATVDNVDNSQFNLTFTETHAQSDLAALFISNVVGRSQMALNLNIASSQFTTVPFAANAISGDVTGTIKQVNTALQFRGTPLVGATGVTTGVNLTVNHQNQ